MDLGVSLSWISLLGVSAQFIIQFILLQQQSSGVLTIHKLLAFPKELSCTIDLFIIIMRSPIYLLLVIVYLGVVSASVNPIWNPIPSIRAGQVQCVSSLLTAQDKAINITIPYSSLMGNGSNSNYSELQYGVSLISYQSWMTDTFSFNITLENITYSAADARFTVLDNTFVTKAKIHYIVIWTKGLDVISSFQYKMQVIYGCYLTTLLQVSPSTDNRNQTVGGIQRSSLASTLTFPYDQLVVKTMISGLQLSNSIGNNNQVKISPTFLNATNASLNYFVEVQSNNQLTFFCVSTVIVDPTVHKVTYIDNIEYQTYTLTSTNGGLSSVPYMFRYDGTDRMFFGISQFNLSMSDTRYLNVETSNISLVSLLYASNAALNHITYNAIYFAQRNCTAPTYYDPVNYTCVDTSLMCVNSVADGSPGFVCNPCHYSCQNCTAGGNSNACSICPTNSFRTKTGTACPCNTGYTDVGVATCQLCNKTLVGCEQCNNTLTCTKCTSPTYNLSGVVCVCPNNTYMASGFCLSYPGCLVAQPYNNIIACKACDSTNNFINVTSNYTCDCNVGYLYNSTDFTCYDECGDNKTAEGKCDDGNRNSSDGCDANCNVETGYHCSTNVSGGLSDCVLKNQITVSYLYTERVIETNSFKMVFLVSPTQANLTSTSFNNNFNTTIPYLSHKVTFDPQSSRIYLQGVYGQDLEGSTYSASISFNNMGFYADSQKLSFNAVGINAQLVVDKNASSNSILKYLVIAEALIALLLAIFASIVGLKFVGIQLLIPVQLIYFSLATLPQQRTYTSILNNLKYANGFNTINSYQYKRTYSQNKNLVGMNYQTEFLLSTNIMLAIFVIILLWLLVHHFVLKYKYYKLERFLQSHSIAQPQQQNSGDEQEEEEDEQKRKLKKRRINSNSQLDREESELREDHHRSFKIFSFEVDRIYFVFYFNLINQIMFGFIVMTLNVPISTFIFAQEINVLICNFIFFIFIGNIVFISYDQESNKMIVFTCIKDRYAYVFLLLDFIIITVLAMTFQEKYSTFLVCALSSSFAILVLKEKPYNKVFLTMENLIAFYLQAMLLISLIILCLVRGNKEDSTSLTYTFFIIALIAVGEVLTVIRIISKVNFKKAFDDLKNPHKDDENDKKMKKVIEKNLDLLQEDKNVQIVPSQSVRNGLFAPKEKMVDWQSKNTEQYESMRQREREQNSEEDANHENRENRENRVDPQEFSQNKQQKLNELQVLKKRLRNNLKLKKEQDSMSMSKKAF